MYRSVTAVTVSVFLMLSVSLSAVDIQQVQYSSNPIVSFFQKAWHAVTAQINRSVDSLESIGAVNCVVALDVSGSMVSNFHEIKNRTTEFLDIFDHNDYLTLFTFEADSSRPFYGRMSPENKLMLKQALTRMQATGLWTDLKKAARKSELHLQQMMQVNPANTGIILMVTDGVDDPPPSIKENRRRNGINLSYDLTDTARGWRIERGWQIYQINGQAGMRGRNPVPVGVTGSSKAQVNSTVPDIRRRVRYTRIMTFILLLLVVLLLVFLGQWIGRKRRSKTAGVVAVVVFFLLAFFLLPQIMAGIGWLTSQIGSILL